ncbi:MAG TPA: hypothetical protein VGE13_01630 [Candidatus Saccharimonadales bacterium]
MLDCGDEVMHGVSGAPPENNTDGERGSHVCDVLKHFLDARSRSCIFPVGVGMVGSHIPLLLS